MNVITLSEVLDTLLTQTAAARILVRLLDGRKYGSELLKGPKSNGVAWPDAFRNARKLLRDMGLVEQEEEPHSKTPRAKKYLELTDKGRKVAEHLEAIQDLLDQTP